MADELKPGDRVTFQFEGDKKGYVGQGQVTRPAFGKGIMIQPDVPLHGSVKLINIKKVG